MDLKSILYQYLFLLAKQIILFLIFAKILRICEIFSFCMWEWEIAKEVHETWELYFLYII